MRNLLLIVAAILVSMSALRSQNPAPQTTQEILARLKADNAELLQKQKKTLETLDQLLQESNTIRIWSKRS